MIPRLDERARGSTSSRRPRSPTTGRSTSRAWTHSSTFTWGHRVHGLTILGLMGEAPKLTFEEAPAFVTRVLARVAGRVPVVVGVSNPGLAPMKALTARVMDLGAAGVMIAPAHGLKGDEAVETYFRAVFDLLGDVPVCLQDYPQETGCPARRPADQPPDRHVPADRGLQARGLPGLVKLSRIRAGEREGHRRLSILVGNGGLYLPQELARGADGAMTGFAFPEMLVEVYERFTSGGPKRRPPTSTNALSDEPRQLNTARRG